MAEDIEPSGAAFEGNTTYAEPAKRSLKLVGITSSLQEQSWVERLGGGFRALNISFCLQILPEKFPWGSLENLTEAFQMSRGWEIKVLLLHFCPRKSKSTKRLWGMTSSS